MNLLKYIRILLRFKEIENLNKITNSSGCTYYIIKVICIVECQ